MLTPGELAQLGQWLRKQGFGVTSHQLIAAGRLINGTRRFASREALEPYLASLFCSDAQMQRRFVQCYRDWLVMMGDAGALTPQPDVVASGQSGAQGVGAGAGNMGGRPAGLGTEAAEGPQRAVAALPQHSTRGVHYFKHIWPGLCLLLAVAGGLYRVEQQYNRAKAEAASTLGPHSSVLAKQGPVVPLPTVPGLGGAQPQIGSVSTTHTKSVPPGSAPPTSAPSEPLPPVAKVKVGPTPGTSVSTQPRMLLAVALLLLAAVCVGWAHLRRARFLRSLSASLDTNRALHLLLGNSVTPPFAKQLKRLGPALRQRYRATTRELDVAASLQATLQKCGVATLVLGGKVEPHYLILLDRNSPADQFAQWADAMLVNWLAQGVDFVCYRFAGDLHTLHPHPLAGTVCGPGWQTLEQLAQRHVGARLIIISDGASLIDRYSGQVHARVAQLQAFAQSLLLTPTARTDWTAREWLLGRAGLQILPLDETGLLALAQFYASPATLPAVAEVAREQRGPGYWHNQDLWLDRVAPPAADIANLVQDLHKHLGLAGLAWLAAGGACPKLDWGMLLALGARLRYQAGQAQACAPWQLPDAAAQAACLLQLVGLPWLRHGFMPVWLRQALLAELPVACHQQIRHALYEVLGTLRQASVMNASPISLRFHQPHWLVMLVAWWARRSKVPEGADDKLFVSVLGGHWTLPTQAWSLRQWLHPQGLAMAGPQRALVLAGLATALVLIGTTGEQVIQDCDICPELVAIPGGEFVMGEVEGQNSEKPGHWVKVGSFFLGRYEVTQGQWRALMGNNPSYFKDCGDNCPVEHVSWDDAQAYLQKLSERTGQHYRLPTEAEWEYAARAGSTARWHFGDKEWQLERYAWFGMNSGGKIHLVGKKRANPFGLYDMHGNVSEWIEDCHHDNYQDAPANGSAWVSNCNNDYENNHDYSYKVVRGGGFFDNSPYDLRAANRHHNEKEFYNNDSGLRVAKTAH